MPAFAIQSRLKRSHSYRQTSRINPQQTAHTSTCERPARLINFQCSHLVNSDLAIRGLTLRTRQSRNLTTDLLVNVIWASHKSLTLLQIHKKFNKASNHTRLIMSLIAAWPKSLRMAKKGMTEALITSFPKWTISRTLKTLKYWLMQGIRVRIEVYRGKLKKHKRILITLTA